MAKQKTKTIDKDATTTKQTDGRPPVVVILGHVDHGKTTLLDYIRKSRVAEKEAGRITQHVGAYQIAYKNKKITFVDTPGHEAFSEMRKRGGQVSDIAVLVIAADDGVMPQTKESIAHIKAAGVPFIVAINKIDLPGTNIEKIKNQLAKEDVYVEGYGGDVVVVGISAKTGEGVDDLLEMIDLLAEIAQLKSQPNLPFKGIIIESKLDKFRGPVASLIIKEGTIRVGMPIFSNTTVGKARAVLDYLGKTIKEAGPSTPVEIIGFSAVPKVGEIVQSTPTQTKEAEITPKKLSIRDRIAASEENKIRLIIKADVSGSLEAIINALESLKGEQREVKVYFSGVGDISESDILLAAATNSLVIGFNVSVTPSANRLAQEEKVLIRNFALIYELLEELKEGLDSLEEAKREEEILGESEILAVFKTSSGKVAGGKVSKGKINKDNLIVIKRDDKELGRSNIASMKNKKSAIREALEGEEFGLLLEKDLAFTKGDKIVAIGRSD